jgi:hypothetical protein
MHTLKTFAYLAQSDTFPSSRFFWGAGVVLAICLLLLLIDWLYKP